MSLRWQRCLSLLRASLEWKYLPFTILIVLSAVSLVSRIILLLR